jgi:hypothetical protein
MACRAAEPPDLDPDALSILKATVASITGAKTLSFRVRIARDRQATNNQLVTYFNDDVVTISRPDKLRIDVDGEHNDVQFLYDGKQAVILEPEHKFYVSQPAPSTIDAVIDSLEKQGRRHRRSRGGCCWFIGGVLTGNKQVEILAESVLS